LAVKTIARAFDLQLKDVRSALEKGSAILRGRGEHAALEKDIGQQQIDWTTKNAHNHNVTNRTELLRYCRAIFGAAITTGWIDSFILRHELELSETIN
jgi:hypothetical protein